jgi:hypothetical protein
MQKPFKAADLVYMIKGLLSQTVTTSGTEPSTPALDESMNGILGWINDVVDT